MPDIGEKIKKIRELKNYTQEYMATKLEMSQAGYGKIERNESEISYQKLHKIAKIFKLKVEDLIYFNERILFNLTHSSADNDFSVNSKLTDQEKLLYEQIITQQKEEILFLKKIIEGFQKEKCHTIRSLDHPT